MVATIPDILEWYRAYEPLARGLRPSSLVGPSLVTLAATEESKGFRILARPRSRKPLFSKIFEAGLRRL